MVIRAAAVVLFEEGVESELLREFFLFATAGACDALELLAALVGFFFGAIFLPFGVRTNRGRPRTLLAFVPRAIRHNRHSIPALLDSRQFRDRRQRQTS